jgi:type I restriction enzyme S subunit
MNSSIELMSHEVGASVISPSALKQTRWGPVPQDWEVVSLERISSFITKGSTPTTYGFRWENSGVLFLRSECVSASGLDLGESMFISLAAHTFMRRSEVRDGDILITITGNVGRAVLLANVGIANLNQHIARIRISNPSVDSMYVYHYLSQPSVRKTFESITTGQAYPQISLAQVRDAEIALPAGPEQRAIASVLTDVDELIASLERLIAKKRAIKQGAMQRLLTGKTRLPGFDGEWSEAHLGEVANFHKGAGLSKGDLSSDGSLECIHYGELFTKYGPHIVTVRKRTDRSDLPVRSAANDVLMPTSDVTPRGLATASAIMKPGVILGGDILIIRSHAGRLYGPFLASLIRLDRSQVMDLVSGTTVYHIYASDLKHFGLRIPPLDEQRAICSVLSDIDADVFGLEQLLTKTKDIKQGMMQELLTGRTRLVPQEALA